MHNPFANVNNIGATEINLASASFSIPLAITDLLSSLSENTQHPLSSLNLTVHNSSVIATILRLPFFEIHIQTGAAIRNL